MLTVILKGIFEEREIEHIDELAQHRPGVSELLVEALEFIGLITTPKAEDEAPARQAIGHADLGEKPGRVIKRRDQNGGCQLDPVGLTGAVRDHDQRRRADTIIGKNTFFDNQIHIAHNVKIGDNCIIAGQVGIIDHLNIGDNSIIAAKSGVFRSFTNGSFISGIPARNHNDRIKQDVLVSKLPGILKIFDKNLVDSGTPMQIVLIIII
mgnify:CR=1 FL=1